ncbi:MAG: DUF2723 domain-containing protein [Kiritimatiellae bacterium]|nr:DUF2723 domain-containing protein [Kiritimatiellia bacterium]
MIKRLFSVEAKGDAFFRRIDWTAFWSATAISFLVYFFTLGPSVGLEDSGELATAADHLGVPHPPGYPFWTLCSWLFCRLFSWVTYMGQPTPAWAVSLFSAVAGAFAAGCTAMLICRSGSDMLDSMEKGPQESGSNARRNALMGFAGGLGGALVFAFSPVEWSQSTIVEIYSLNALFLMAVFLLSYRWMRRPSHKILWLTAFVFGLGLTNYQVLLMAALPLAIIILLKDIRLFRDFTLVLVPIALTAQVLQIGSKFRASSAMSADVINKFAPLSSTEACPNEILLWAAFALVAAAPIVGKILAMRGKPGNNALRGAVGTGLAGALLVVLSTTMFAGKAAWTNPEFAPLVEPAKYAWIGAFLAAAFALSLGAVFAPTKAGLSDRSVWGWLAGAGLCAFVACSIAASLPSAGAAGYTGEAFGWTKPAFTLVAGLALLAGLSLMTPRGLAFAIPVAAVQTAAFVLLSKGAMNGLTHPSTWWFIWTVVWFFAMLGLATVALPNGKAVGPAILLGALGVSFYAYMPIVSDLRNPPMNWGYPRTWEGFKHALMRGQYEQIKMPSLFTADGFGLFCKQMGFYFQDLRMQFTLVAAALALVPFALWRGTVALKNKTVRIPAARIAVWLYVATAALVIVFSELLDGEVPGRLDKLLLFAMFLLAAVGVGAMVVRQALVVARQLSGRNLFAGKPDAAVRVNVLADDVTQQWLIAVGACFAIMSFFLVALANVRGDIQDGFIQKVKFISSHGMFSLWIGYGLVVGLVVANRLAKKLFAGNESAQRLAFGASCAAAACIALIPIYENYMNDKLVFAMGSAEQNGHTFGWQFGNYQLRGANAIREELSPDEEPLPNPLWPEEMEPSSIFFGGTDPGRFVPTYMIYSANVRPDVYLITQNALADDTYMSVERDLYGDEIWIPSKEDSAEAFNIYVSEVQSGKRPKNGDLRIENGRVQVTGALGVMEINGILTKMMFDHERLRHAFYVEESYVIQWMYDYLTPHGLIMKINADKGKLDEATARDDMEFWDWYTRRLLLDPAFRRDFAAQKSFSKLRAAIAGLYADSRTRSRTDGDFQKYSNLAAQAFREAVALYPASPEATFRYISEILGLGSKWDAILDMVGYTDRVDPNNHRTTDVKKHALAARNAAAAIGTIRAAHDPKAANTATAAANSAFPKDILAKLSQTELETLADARLDYAEANLMFRRASLAYQCAAWAQSNPVFANSFERLWRSAMIFERLGRHQEAALDISRAIKFPEADNFAILNQAIDILARAGKAAECSGAMTAALKLPEANNFGTLLRYARLARGLNDDRQAVQLVSTALAARDGAAASNLIDAGELLCKVDAERYKAYVAEHILNYLRARGGYTVQDTGRMASLYLECDDMQGAEACLQAVVRSAPGADAYFQLALVEVRLGKTQEARAAMASAFRHDPGRSQELARHEPWQSLVRQLMMHDRR